MPQRGDALMPNEAALYGHHRSDGHLRTIVRNMCSDPAYTPTLLVRAIYDRAQQTAYSIQAPEWKMMFSRMKALRRKCL